MPGIVEGFERLRDTLKDVNREADRFFSDRSVELLVDDGTRSAGGAAVENPARFARDRGPLPSGTASGTRPADSGEIGPIRAQFQPAGFAPAAGLVDPSGRPLTVPTAPTGRVSSGGGGRAGGGAGGGGGRGIQSDDILFSTSGRGATREFLGAYCKPITVSVPNPNNRLALQHRDFVEIPGWDCRDVLGPDAIFIDYGTDGVLSSLGASAGGSAGGSGGGRSRRRPIRRGQTSTTAATDADSQIGSIGAGSREGLDTLRDIRDDIRKMAKNRPEDGEILARVSGLR